MTADTASPDSVHPPAPHAASPPSWLMRQVGDGRLFLALFAISCGVGLRIGGWIAAGDITDVLIWVAIGYLIPETIGQVAGALRKRP